MDLFKQLIGTTSWLFPGTYYQNARSAAQKVDFVELLVYQWDEETHKLLSQEIGGLMELKQQGLLYTVHLPTNDIEEARGAFEFFENSELDVMTYVLHPLDGFKDFQWNEKVAIENMVGKVEAYDKMVFDIGHHMLGEKFPPEYLDSVVEIHLMGVNGNQDHLKLNDDTLEELCLLFGDKLYSVPYICFEIFDMDLLEDSLKIWKNMINRG
ncbi:hypothetical protein JOD02_000439 [Caldicoprobacter guelmensis]|uniref:cobamide remodeling phosphodiesterase CbiR n=1 Tax=Caldicoprobacter guelmensis TaxID=1170224 RepID=UPI001956D46D|nr:cobamide remodeling phosphodiesterase CbiR [Caldicoprobacter guelmensis]MBM7581616.1 hypothetical protein [Caldicoprobacter guelmensis]